MAFIRKVKSIDDQYIAEAAKAALPTLAYASHRRAVPHQAHHGRQSGSTNALR